MGRLYVERRELRGQEMGLLATDITHHLYTRQLKGVALIVVEEPFLLLRIARKRWLQLIQSVQRERARTLNAARIAELSLQIARMNNYEFLSKLPLQNAADGAFFISPGDVPFVRTDCHTVYIGTQLSAESQIHAQQITTRKGLIVIYELSQL